MRLRNGITAFMFTATALISTSALTGCAGGAIIFDPYQQDYHRWNGVENRYYRQWEVETNRPHMEFDRRPAGDLRAYWEYRHK